MGSRPRVGTLHCAVHRAAAPAAGTDAALPIEAADLLAALLAGALVFALTAAAWRGVASTRDDLRQDLELVPWAFATAVLWHPGLTSALFERALFAPLPEDSFLTLSTGGRSALVLVAVLAGLALVLLSVRKTRALRQAFMRRATLAPAALDLVATVLLGLGALALAPQLFYTYYRRLIPDLPAQRVIEGLPSAGRLRDLARPLANGSLAEHAAALALWTLLIACLLGWMLDVRRRRRALGRLPAAAIVAVPATLWALATTPLA